LSVEVIAIGGYEEVGKNMSAVKVGDDVVIFDMGIHLDRVHIHEDTDIARMLNPMHIIPAHGDLNMLSAYAEVAEEEGYKLGNDIHILRNGQAQVFNGGIR